MNVNPEPPYAPCTSMHTLGLVQIIPPTCRQLYHSGDASSEYLVQNLPSSCAKVMFPQSDASPRISAVLSPLIGALPTPSQSHVQPCLVSMQRARFYHTPVLLFSCHGDPPLLIYY